LRIAIVSSPRSGNMWLRRLLRTSYGLDERSAFRPDELDWERLPDRCVLQFHWHRTPEFRELLERYGYSVVVLARHPLDVLVSILHFSAHEPDTARWLDGEGGDESILRGADPTSPAFLTYATSPRARALLSVTPEWWTHANVCVRYESLVDDPASELGRLLGALGGEPVMPPGEAVEAVSFASLQQEAPNQHFWQGRAELWRELVPTPVAREIAPAYPDLHRFGYSIGVSVDEATARANWSRVAVAPDPTLAAAS
jgi:hypothetical protein